MMPPFREQFDLAPNPQAAAFALGFGPLWTVAVNSQSGTIRFQDFPVIIDVVDSEAFIVGPNAETDPTLRIDTATASAVTGLKITAGTSGNPIVLDATSANSNCAMTLNGKGVGGVSLKGQGNNTAAAAGYVGEIMTSSVASGSAESLTTNTSETVASLSLTAGVWDVEGIAHFIPANTTTVSVLFASISETDDTDATGESLFAQMGTPYTSTGAVNSVKTPVVRKSFNSTTSVYLVGRAIFATSTCTQYGAIRATRVI